MTRLRTLVFLILITMLPGLTPASHAREASFSVAGYPFETVSFNSDLSLREAPDAPLQALGLSISASAVPECLFCLDYGKLILSDTVHVLSAPLRWEKKEWLVFSLATLGIGITALLDKPVFEAFRRHPHSTSDQIADLVQPFGSAYSIGILSLFYLNGIVSENPKATAVAQDGLAASLIGQGISTVVKRIAGRSRPRDHQGTSSFRPFSGNTSFPSGHATQAFTVASVISTHYPRPAVQAVSYGIAGLVGYARIVHNGHFVSDVAAGALIGTAVGKAVVHFNQKKRTGLQVNPLIDPDLRGLAVAWTF